MHYEIDGEAALFDDSANPGQKDEESCRPAARPKDRQKAIPIPEEEEQPG
jgi:hypothetical protein